MADGKPFKCVELLGRGRAIVTTRRVRAGEIVLKDSPSLLYVDSASVQRFCGSCLRICSGTDSAECSSCTVVQFCSLECRASFPKDLCSALGQLKEAAFDPERENQARFLLAAYHLALVSPKKFENLLLLEGGGDVDDDVGVFNLHSFVEKAVGSWPWKSDRELSPKLTADLLVKDMRNGLGMMAPCEIRGERSVRGYGLYATAAFINHECLPNCCRFDYIDRPGKTNTDILIRAMYDIEPETEITISYFPINWPYEVRQERLQKEYGFKCVCQRCNAEQGWSDTEGRFDEEEEEVEEEEEEDAEHLQNGKGEILSLHNSVEALGLKTSKMATSSDQEKLEEEGAVKEEEEDDFQHAMFFVKYLCPLEDCGGTMAPIPPNSDNEQEPELEEEGEDDGDLFSTMECNMCGHVRTGDEFRKDLEENRILE